MRNFKTLDTWEESVILANLVYEMTEIMPQSERFGLTQQIRRSAVSIASNIAEGCGRDSDKEYAKFLGIALGSAFELETQIILSRNIHYLSDESFELLSNQAIKVQKMIGGIRRSLNSDYEI